VPVFKYRSRSHLAPLTPLKSHRATRGLKDESDRNRWGQAQKQADIFTTRYAQKKNKQNARKRNNCQKESCDPFEGEQRAVFDYFFMQYIASKAEIILSNVT
jgi:hypothetical protein